MTELSRVDINLLVVLDAVLTERTVTGACETLGITQQALRSALARLGQQFGDPLAVREGGIFELTPMAEQLRPAVRSAITAIHHTLDELPAFDPATSSRTFFITGSDYLLSEMSGPLQSLFRDRAPKARVEYDALPIGPTIGPVELLRRDVVVAGTGRGVPGKHRPLFLDRFVCIGAADHPKLVDGAMTAEDVAELRHVRSTFGAQQSTHVDEMLAAAGIQPRIGISVEGFLQVPFMVAGTELIGFVPERVAQRHAAPLGLTIIETPVEPMTLVEAAYWHPSRNSDPALKWLVDMMLLASEVIEFGTLQTG